MALKTKVEVAVARYLEDFNQYEENTEKLLDEAVLKTKELKRDHLLSQLNEQIASFKENFESQAQNHNNLLKVVLEEERENLFPSVDKTEDYAARVANAIKFIEMEGSEINDDIAYSILKDFTHDYDQMKLFKRMIDKQVTTVNASGNTTFPKTFGIYNQKEFVHNTFEELESFAENIFINSIDSGATTIIYNTRFAVPIRNYKQQLAEKKVVELAAHIDETIERIKAA